MTKERQIVSLEDIFGDSESIQEEPKCKAVEELKSATQPKTVEELLYGENCQSESESQQEDSQRGLTIMMTKDLPSEEGHYFVQYHRNFQPVMCVVEMGEDEQFWLHTRSTSKPLKDIKAYCFSERL